MTTVSDVLDFLEGFAPPELAESWDNVGLLCGDRAARLQACSAQLDASEDVIEEAIRARRSVGCCASSGDFYIGQSRNNGRRHRPCASSGYLPRNFHHLYAYQCRLRSRRCQ